MSRDREPSGQKQPLLILGAAAAALAVVTVVDGVGREDPAPEPEPSSSTSAGPLMPEASFLDATSSVAGASEEDLLEAGYATCGALERADATTVYLAAARTSGSTGVTITRAAAANLCPEQGAAVEGVAAAVAP